MELIYNFTDVVEQVITPLGLMTGEFAVLKRFAFGGILLTLGAVLIKPSCMFENGSVRPWSFLVPENSAYEGPRPTATPLWFASAAGAIVFGVFI